MNEFGKYRLFRKYVSYDGVEYTPLDEYQALLVENNSCQCGYRELEYRFDGEYKNDTFKKYEIWNEYSFCPTDSSYDELTGNVDYRNPITADGVMFATYKGDGSTPVELCYDSSFYERIAINNTELGKKYTSYTFNNTDINEVKFSNVTNIGNYDLYGCPLLKSVTIPSTVTSIGNYAFGFCGLKSITIPNSVTSIGTYAFRDCKRLTSVEIGSGVTSIGDYAFQNCTSLNSITCYTTTAPSLGSSTFSGLPTNGTLHVPNGSDYSSWLTKLPSGWTIEYI